MCPRSLYWAEQSRLGHDGVGFQDPCALYCIILACFLLPRTKRSKQQSSRCSAAMAIRSNLQRRVFFLERQCLHLLDTYENDTWLPPKNRVCCSGNGLLKEGNGIGFCHSANDISGARKWLLHNCYVTILQNNNNNKTTIIMLEPPMRFVACLLSLLDSAPAPWNVPGIK